MVMFSLLAVALACSPGDPEEQTGKSANGKYTLKSSVAGKLTLLGAGSQKALWEREQPWAYRSYVVADSGQWAALIDPDACEKCPEVTLVDARGGTVAALEIVDRLSEEERQFLSHSMCGVRWLSFAAAERDTLVLRVIQGGNVPPIYDQGPTLRIEIDGRTGALTRDKPVGRRSIDELIELHSGAKDQRERHRVLRDLAAKAELTSSRGNPELTRFFQARLQERSEPHTVELATRALAAMKDQPAAPAATPSKAADEDPLQKLQTLSQTDPAGARAFALAALRQKREPEKLRVRAVEELVRDGVDARFEAFRLGFADSEKVRQSAVLQLTRLKPSLESLDVLLPIAGGDTTPSAAEVRKHILNYYLRSREDGLGSRARFLAALEAGKLDKWGGAFVVAGGMAEVRRDPKAAQAYYARALAVLDKERPPDHWWADAILWSEARLRLAAFALAAGDKNEAKRLAGEVEAANYTGFVFAPGPNQFSGGGGVPRQPRVAAQVLLNGIAGPSGP